MREPGNIYSRFAMRLSDAFARRASVNLGVLVAACLCASGFGVLRAQTLEVSPNRILSDETAAIRATGLQPNERVTIQATLVDGAEQR